MSPRPTRHGGVLAPWPGAWTQLVVGCLVAVGGAEAVMLEVWDGYFSAGYNGHYVDTPALIAGFFGSAALVDLFALLALWALLLPLLARTRLSRVQVFAAAGVIGVTVPLLSDFIRKRLHRVVGEMIGLDVLYDAAGRSVLQMLAEAVPFLPVVGALLALIALGLAAVLFAVRRLEADLTDAERRFRAPPFRSLAAGSLGCGALAAVVLTWPSTTAITLQAGLQPKASTRVLTPIIQWASDVDRDGYGLLSAPGDPAPFDASIHPYAPDRPANGIDENGLAGDHPAGFVPVVPVVEAPLPGDGVRPHVLIVFLESFRGSLLDLEVAGREVTPFLNALGREGASSRHAYVQRPMTVGSRGQLFGGRMVPYRGQNTLVDDFQQLGYTVALFSGQDDSFGDSEPYMGAGRADHFYDARQDRDLRTSRTYGHASLQVSWKLLNRRVGEYLAEQDPARPLFLYVNVVDTHFPYDHEELDRLIDIDPLPRTEIRASRADRVLETYANAAANVDLAVQRLVAHWRDWAGERPTAVIVTGDHGQSLYEEGFLGHGHSLKDAQSRVPFVVQGLGGDWPEPLGLCDVRGLLRRNLLTARATDPPRPHLAPDPDRRIFQYTASILQPRDLALRSLDEVALYEVKHDRFQILDAREQPRSVAEPVAAAEFVHLIRTWEALQLEEIARGGEGSGRVIRR